MRSPSATASSSSVSWGTTRCTRPMRSACAASTRSPASTIHFVQCRPITAGPRSTPKPGTSPIALSGIAKLARSEASTMSQASASSQPPPNA